MMTSSLGRRSIAFMAMSMIAMCVAGSGIAASNHAAAAPTITSFAPHSGPTGTQVTIRGNNLANASVTFNGVHASISVTASGDNSNNKEITAVVPANAKSGVIAVMANGVTVKTPANFTITSGNLNGAKGKPIVSSFAPTTAKAGAMVTITGQNLGGVSYIKVGGVKAKFFKSLTQKSVSVRVPAGAKSGKISVVTDLGAGTSAQSLTIGS